MQIRALEAHDIPAVAALLRASAIRFVTPEMSAEASELFLKENDADAIAMWIGRGVRYYVAECDATLIGFIALRDWRHIFHLFVDEAWHQRGTARTLWNVARANSRADGYRGAFTVNASNYAVQAYAALGFVQTKPMQCTAGIFYNPMRFTDA